MKKLRNIYIEKCLKGIVTYGNCVRKISKSVVITHSKNFPLYFNDSNTGKRFKKYDVGRIIINSKSIFEFGKKVSFRSGCTLLIDSNAKLKIGDNTFFNNNVEIYCRSSICIGENCSISKNVVIRDSDVHKIKDSIITKPIQIGNNVWIGTNVIVLKGVTIGDGAVIGAGSVVTHDIPSHCMAAGNPCRIIKDYVEWSKR